MMTVSRIAASWMIGLFLFAPAAFGAAKGDAADARAAAKVADVADRTVNSDKPVKPKLNSMSPQVREAVKKVDELVAAGYAEAKVQPGRQTSDEEFLRRLYLDITGTIPNYEQTQAFLDSKDPLKRQKLIDALLDSPGRTSRMYNLFADMLRVTGRIRGDAAGHYAEYIKQSLRENKPYDKLVYELITAEGKSRDNGAVGYWLRDDGMVLEITAQTAELFLGTQIGCAQCHDHPFDKWEMKEFYELAAFTAPVVTRERGAYFNVRELRKMEAEGKVSRQVAQVVQNLIREESYNVSDFERKTLTLPKDYKYDNGKPGQKVDPHVIFGKVDPPKKDQTLRQRFASWLTSKDNPMFATVIANRLWASAIGLGLVNPIDDFSPSNKPTNPALLAYLTELIKHQNFDLKEFQRVIFNSKAYQLATDRNDYTKENFRNQAGVMRRMTAEQVWDSLLTLTVQDPDSRKGSPVAGGQMMMMAAAGDVDLKKMSAEEIIKYAEKLMAERRGAFRDAMIRGGGAGALVRASELRYPLPGGHFLREFGASQRETTKDANVDPTIPQALAMMNGPAITQVAGKSSVLMQNIARAADEKEKVNVIFLSMLNRYPLPNETALGIRELKTNGAKGAENLIWAVMNSREFIFVR
jgi:hypothetical protein